ncbi:hypothetical protein LCL61_27910 [Amycolatopsis coloradensis]|uniref:Uncharacterized protein n=1 Tax=Amycolatopsis coloradensis TaxID=76021 RepID=A0ACD5BIZ4_9PSEU
MRTLTGLPEGEKRAPDLILLGYIFLAIVAMTVVAALVVLALFLPDIRRYLTIRKM